MLHIISLIICTSLVFAQQKLRPEMERTAEQVISQQGNLMSVKVVKGEPIKIFFFEKEQAEVDLSQLDFAVDVDMADLTVNIRQVNPHPGRALKIKQVEKHYEIDEPFRLQNNVVLQVDVEKKDAEKPKKKVKETFRIKMDGPK